MKLEAWIAKLLIGVVALLGLLHVIAFVLELNRSEARRHPSHPTP